MKTPDLSQLQANARRAWPDQRDDPPDTWSLVESLTNLVLSLRKRCEPKVTLIREADTIVAALFHAPFTPEQFKLIQAAMPWTIGNHPDLANRWNVHQVIAENDWAQTQRRRRPCFKPKGSTLAFVEPETAPPGSLCPKV